MTATGSGLPAAPAPIRWSGRRETIAADMIAIAEQGYDGIALSFVNYTHELP